LSIRLKAELFSLPALHFDSNQIDENAWGELEENFKRQGNFLSHSPVILDFSVLSDADTPPDFDHLVKQTLSLSLVASACRAPKSWQDAIVNAGLGFLPQKNSKEKEGKIKQDNPTAHAVTETEKNDETQPLIAEWHNKPLRSGQQLYNKDHDLTLHHGLSHGAEIASDGHVYVLGHARGRIHAGVSGNQSARIFCYNFDPELISIAGIYQTNEELPDTLRNKSVVVTLQDNHLHIKSL